MKVVINTCYGGFSLSKEACKKLNLPKHDSGYNLKRNDPELIKLVEELGEDAWGGYAELKIIEIPDDVQWHIEEYDGREWVAEDHRTWP